MAKYTTGIFYHPSFSRRSYLTVGARLADFPRVLDRILESDKVKLYEPRAGTMRGATNSGASAASTMRPSADIGLSGPCYWNIADLMKGLAGKVCDGRLEVVLGGGSHRRFATYLIPPIIERLAGL